MRFLEWTKDGGQESTVSGLYFVEIKSLFTIVLLRFSGKSREAYHSHAFNALSWVLKGKLVEHIYGGMDEDVKYTPSLKPIYTSRSRFHKVDSDGETWVLSFRGAWANTWREYIPNWGFRILTHGRKVVG
jgi:hypothetical protein